MNRSILIVICDFIITSMIYLNGGFSALESQPHDGRPADQTTMDIMANELEMQRAELEAARAKLLKAGGKVSQEELERITSELARANARLEQLKRQKELNDNNSGVMSRADIQREISEEIYQKHLAQERYTVLQQQLQIAREDQQTLRRESSLTQQENAKLDERIAGQREQYELKLSEKEREIKERKNALDKQARQLADTNKKLDAARSDLAERDKALTGAAKDLEHARKEIKNNQEMLRDSKAETVKLRSKLNDAESRREAAEKARDANKAALARARAEKDAAGRQLAGAKDALNKEKEKVKNAKAELESKQRNIDTMKRMVDDTSRKLSNAQDERNQAERNLEKIRRDLERIQKENIALKADSAKLKAVQKELDFFKNDLAQTNHSDALAILDLQWEQHRTIGRNLKISRKSFLPVFQLGSRSYVVSTLNVIGGRQKNSSIPENIISLEYKAGKPGNAAAKVISPIRLANDDLRVALLDVTGLKGIKPLKLLTWKELRKRGSLDLYLFKSDSMHNAKLENRCTWGVGNDKYIYVTNNSRAANELKAQAGDLLMTRQGELAGVVVSVKNNRACCYVFPAAPAISKMPRIDQGSRQSKYQEFITGMSVFWQKGDKLSEQQP